MKLNRKDEFPMLSYFFAISLIIIGILELIR
jgi:hypothetical protein